MTIGWRTPGAWASGSTSVAPALPASPGAGDRMILFVGAKPFGATIADVTNWTRIGTQQTNGSVANATDAGSVTWSVFYRDWQPGDAAPTVTVTGGNVALAVIHGATKTAASWDTVTAYFGSDTSSGTGYSITAASSSGNITNGDGLIHATVIAGNNATFATPTISATSATIGTVTESPATEGTTATGLDLEASSASALCTAGTSTADAVAGWTLSVAQTGGSALVRLREDFNTTITPTVATDSLDITGIAPAVGQATSITPAAGALALGEAAPTAVQGTPITPGTGSLITAPSAIWGAHGTDVTLSNGDLDATVDFVGFRGVRSVQGRASGKYYFELLVVATGGAGSFFIGITDDSTATGSAMNSLTFANLLGVRNDTTEAVSGTFSSSVDVGLGAIAVSDVLQCAVDITSKKVWFGKNNTWISGDPGAGTTEWGVWSGAYTIYAGAFLATQAAARLRATAASQSYSPPTGFSAFSAGEAPAVTVATTITPAVGALALTGVAPGVFQPIVITPAAGALTLSEDPYWSSVTSLLHFDGANGSTTFTDSGPAPKTWTRTSGSASISTAQSVFGGASGALAGNLETPAHAGFAVGSGDFTAEIRARFNNTASDIEHVCGQGGTSSAEMSMRFMRLANGVLSVEFYHNSGTSSLSGSTAAAGAWKALSLVRNGNVFSFYIDGVLAQSNNPGAVSLNAPNKPWGLGCLGEYTALRLAGNLDEFRFTKGVARYTANYTPATDAFPDNAPTVRQNHPITPGCGTLNLSTRPALNTTSLIAYYKLGVGITDVAGAVSQWDDQSGSAYHLVQATGADKPAKQADGTILFDGVSDFLKALWTYAQPVSVYIAAKVISTGANKYLFDGGLQQRLALYTNAGRTVTIYAGNFGVTTTPAYTDGVYSVFSTVFNNASSVVQIDDTTAATGTAGTSAGAVAGFTLGAWAGAVPAGFANIQVKEVMVYGAVHDSTQRAAAKARIALAGVDDGIAPTVTVAQTITPSAGALSLTGIAPQVAVSITITPGAGALSITVNNYATWNPADKGTGITLSADNLTASGLTTGHIVRATVGKTSGKWYWEITGATADVWIGTANGTPSVDSTFGANTNTNGARGDNNVTPTGTTGVFWGASDVIGVALNRDGSALTLYKNNSSFWGWGGVGGTVYPALSAATGSAASATANFGATAFVYTPPSGYSALYETVYSGSAPTVRQATAITPSAGALALTGIAPTVASAGDTPIAPTAGALDLTGAAPTLLREDTLTPSVGSLTLAGIATAVLTGYELTPTAGALALTGIAPAVTLQDAIAPTAGALTLTGIAPVLTRQDTIAPAAGALTLTGIAPVFGATSDTRITPTVGTLELTGAAPALTRHDTLTPVAGALSLTGIAAAATRQDSIAPSVGALALTGVAPSSILATIATPAAGALTLTGLAPAVTQQLLAAPGAGSLVLTGSAPANSEQASLTPAAGALALTGIAPTVTQQLLVTPTAGELTLTGAAPQVAQPIAITPAAGALTLTGSVPLLDAQLYLAPDAGALALTGQTASVTRQDTLTPSAGSLELTGVVVLVNQPLTGSLALTGIAPVVLPSLVPGPRVPVRALVLTGFAPSVIHRVTLETSTGALALAGAAPTVTQQGRIDTSAGAIALSGSAPTLIRHDTLAPGKVALALTGVAPVVARQTILTPNAGTLALTGVVPQQAASIVTAAGSLALSGAAPGMGPTASASPAAGALVLTGIAPTVIRQDTLTPAAAALTLTGQAATLASGVVITPTDPALSLFPVQADTALYTVQADTTLIAARPESQDAAVAPSIDLAPRRA